ncbi:RrF2 family transcriptional regulator [Pseudodesulfovibrio piezophilus]|uniref:Protein rrf2 n=1 Tax=Pseudodesulfovibrio piezophilus (strain DSM 21447 / JCM 15486 / C1TLV30) TaxID=1322246 RepID=M1WVY6_PSEP2|nr:RrF2 family transcriptional regulator [Pseudodesulfovibrio piezophilus]CCH48813.1 Protein rrf2 [Pseudodesulfovibrio piezophilus C1TLV30]
MRLTTRSRYGTRMAVDIAQHCDNGLVRIQDIAERQGVSIKYLEKLIRKLKDAGFIKSKRGPRGGHALARPASEIPMGEVVRVLEGDDSLVECRSGLDGCDRIEVCLTRRLWCEAAEAMYERLNSFTLADMLADVEQCAQSESRPMLMD